MQTNLIAFKIKYTLFLLIFSFNIYSQDFWNRPNLYSLYFQLFIQQFLDSEISQAVSISVGHALFRFAGRNLGFRLSGQSSSHRFSVSSLLTSSICVRLIGKLTHNKSRPQWRSQPGRAGATEWELGNGVLGQDLDQEKDGENEEAGEQAPQRPGHIN